MERYVKVFWSWGQAADQGYLSKSRWRKQRREPLPNAPLAIVVMTTAKCEGWTWRPVLEHLDDGTDLVAMEYYDVVHREHTTPIVKGQTRKRSKPEQSLTPESLVAERHNDVEGLVKYQKEEEVQSLSPSSPSNTSIDRREETIIATAFEETRAFTIIKRRENSVNRIGAFLPENFSQDDVDRLGQYVEQAYCVFHNMHLFRVMRRLPKDAWIDLNYDYLDRRLPHWRDLKPLLLDGILERTTVEEYPVLDIVVPRGIRGHRSYGYRFAKEEYRNARVRKRPITDPKLIEMIEASRNVKYPVQIWLEKNLRQIEMGDVPDEGLLELAVGEDDPQVRYVTYMEQVALIRDKSWIFVADDFSRRIHTNLTQLKRELRAGLRVAGQPLVQIDIKNSQPLFIGLAARKMGVEDRLYLDLCQGDLYQHLADQGGWSRKEVKEQLTQKALFAANSSPHQRLPVKQLFDQEFPRIARFVGDMKAGKKTPENPKPHNKLARLAQRTEANFLIYGGVCDRIRQERPDCWISTIHDSLLVLPQTADYVRGVMLDEFRKIGVQPRLEVESCDR